MRQQPGPPLEAFGGPAQTGFVAQVRPDFEEHGTKSARGYRNEHVAGAFERRR